VNWFCLHTKPLKESQVASYCATQLSLETYYPRLKQQRTIRRQQRIVIGPLFPRYLFCRFDARLLYRAVRYAPEVITVVSAGNAPAVVEDSLIESLRSWTGSENDILTLTPSIRPGDTVEIVAGPMQGLSGTILAESSDRNRVKLLLSFLQEGAHLSVDRADVRLIA